MVVKAELAKSSQKNYKLNENVAKALPSLDLRPWLKLFAPDECTFAVGGNDERYGGHIEIIHRESQKVNQLTAKCEEVGFEQQLIGCFGAAFACCDSCNSCTRALKNFVFSTAQLREIEQEQRIKASMMEAQAQKDRSTLEDQVQKNQDLQTARAQGT